MEISLERGERTKGGLREDLAHLFLLSVTGLGLLYGGFGHPLIQAAYDGRSWRWLNQIIEGRGTVPLEHYLGYADQLVLTAGSFLFGLFLMLQLRLVAKALSTLATFFVISFTLFLGLEISPGLAQSLRLQNIPYYSFRARNIPDSKLVYRNRPFYHVKLTDYRGELYSPIYGVEAPAFTYEERMDSDGFRNPRSEKLADVVVLGDSLIEFGVDEDDPFVRRLARNSGLRTKSLGLGNYGPFQYLEVLKEFGLAARPKFALLSFSEGTDLLDVRMYLHWKAGGNYYDSLPPRNLLQRYFLTLRQQYLRFQEPPPEVRKDLVDIKLGGRRLKAIFGDLNDERPPEEIAASGEFQELEKILKEFKEITLQHQILPFLVYIPVTAHVYAEYTTEASDENWLKRREEQIAAKANLETAVEALCRKLDFPFFSLTPVFEKGAREGQMLYYPFDTHWNSEGMELAAARVAEKLREMKNSASFNKFAAGSPLTLNPLPPKGERGGGGG